MPMFRIVNLDLEYFAALEKLQRICYPTLADHELMNVDMYESQYHIFRDAMRTYSSFKRRKWVCDASTFLWCVVLTGSIIFVGLYHTWRVAEIRSFLDTRHAQLSSRLFCCTFQMCSLLIWTLNRSRVRRPICPRHSMRASTIRDDPTAQRMPGLN